VNTPSTSPTTGLEDALRATLRRRAGSVPPRADAGAVHRRVHRRRRRRQIVPAVAAVAVIGGGIAVTAWKDDPAETSTAAQPPQESLAPRSETTPYVELPGWHLERYHEIRYAGGVVEPEYQWTSDGRQMQLHLYPGGQAMFDLRVSGEVRPDVELFGRPASLLDYGTGRYRVDVLVGDDTFEFDGERFESADDFLAAIATAHGTSVAPPAEVTAEPIEFGVPYEVGAGPNATAIAEAPAPAPAPTAQPGEK
jgi:hypothetical protein